MKRFATCAIIVATSTVAQAQTITVFQTGFEPAEGYTPGNLNGQNGWFAYLGESPNFGEVVTAGALAGTQSVLLDGLDVQIGAFGNYAACGRLTPIAPNLSGAPLRYIEVTARCAIIDPTIVPTHHSNMWLAQYQNDVDKVTIVGTGSRFGQHVYGYPINGGPNPMVPVTPGVAFDVRHLVDYRTGFAAAWKDGEVVFQNFAEGFQSEFITNEFYFESVSINNLPFDTRVWFDDIRITAIYGCAADTNSDAQVNVDDLIAVILGWGPCPKPPAACQGDTTGDGQINVDDLIAVILGWGSCS